MKVLRVSRLRIGVWRIAAAHVRPQCLAGQMTRCMSSSASDSIEAQALVYSKHGEPSEVLELNTHHIPSTLPQDSILIRTLAAPINPADMNTVQGTYGRLPRMVNSPFGPGVEALEDPSAVPGNEGVFKVIATGRNVAKSEFAVGDWVIPMSPGYGTWRSHILAPTSGFFKVPSAVREKGLTPVQAATVSVNPLTALRLVSDFGTRFENGFERRGLDQGEWLLQNGANSAVGRLVIQLARMKGLKTLNVIRQRHDTYSTEPLRQELRALGADVVVTDAELGRPLAETLKNFSGGEGANLMLDCIGGRMAASLARSLNEGGEVVTYGAMSGKPITPGTGMLIFKDIRFRGFWVSRWGDRFPEDKKQALNFLLGLIVDGKLDTGRVEPIAWNKESVKKQGRKALVDPVQKTLDGFKAGKSVFVFEDE